MTDAQPVPIQQSRLLTDGSISRGLFQLAVPILCTNVLQSLNGSVNSIWVGRYLGEAALAAVSNAHLVIMLLTGVALGVAIAATILVGQCVGAGNLTDAKRVTGTSATFFLGMSVVLAVAGLTLSEPLLVLMKVPTASLSLAVAYIRVEFIALPSIYMYVFVTSILRGVGDSKTPFYFMLLSVALDVVLNPLFIFGVGPIPGAGIAGSAFAMFVAHAVSLTALIVHLYRRRHPLCLRKGELSLLRVDAFVFRTLVRMGIPIGAEVVVFSLSGVIMIVLVNRFGVDTTAAYGASLQLWVYVQMPAIAISMAVATMVALNIGGQQWDRVRSVARVGVVYSILLTGAIVLVVCALDTYLFRLFLPAGSPALSIASHINRVVAWSFVFLGISIVLFAVVRAARAVMVPLVVYTLTLLVVRFPLAAILLDRWEADAIWWSFPISLAFTVALAMLYYRYGRWKTVPLRIPVSLEGVRTSP